MLTRARVLATGIHLPLRKLALCLDCDECFGSTTDSLPFRGGKPIHLIRKYKWLDYLDAWAGAHHPKPAP